MGLHDLQTNHLNSQDSLREVVRDVRFILWSMKLHTIIRYHNQRHWETETLEEDYASRLRTGARLESVSEHSWHLADTILLLGPRFPRVDYQRAIELAILHDKLELITGDKSPIGRNGTGSNSHAFNATAREKKDRQEVAALEKYLARITLSAQNHQRAAFDELSGGLTKEARLVKAIDKFQTLAYVHCRKDGQITDQHLTFTIKYAQKSVEFFPEIEAHFNVLSRIFLKRVAKIRKVSLNSLNTMIQSFDTQMELFS